MLLMLTGCGRGCRSNGVSSAYPRALPDGTVVLVRDAKGCGAFVLRNQWPASREQLDFEYYYRTNRNGALGTNESGVEQGYILGAKWHVEFGTFKVPWSGAGKGRGWLYYARDQHGAGSRGGWEMCITAETNVEGIRPDDPRWQYRDMPPFSWEAEKKWFRNNFKW